MRLGGAPRKIIHQRLDSSIESAGDIVLDPAAVVYNREGIYGRVRRREGRSLDSDRPSIMTGSKAEFNLSKTTKYLRRSRPMKHRYHYLPQQVQAHRFTVVTMPGKYNREDLLAKLLCMTVMKEWKQRWMSSPYGWDTQRDEV